MLEREREREREREGGKEEGRERNGEREGWEEETYLSPPNVCSQKDAKSCRMGCLWSCTNCSLQCCNTQTTVVNHGIIIIHNQYHKTSSFFAIYLVVVQIARIYVG